MQKNKVVIGVVIVLIFLGVFLSIKQNKESSQGLSNGVRGTQQKEQEIVQIDTKDIKNKKNTNMNENQKIPTQTVKGAIISTNLGDIEVVFSEMSAPKTVANFVSLASTHFYDGIKFHRVISGFMIQAGDPLTKDDSKQAYWGTGGPDYRFPDELTGDEVYSYGTLAMANSGKDTNGSQFFIVSANPKVDLPPAYTVFGKVVGGMDIVEKIQNVSTDKANDRPYDPVIIKAVKLQ